MKVQITHADGVTETWESHLAQYEVTTQETLVRGRSAAVETKRDISIILRGATQVREETER